MVYSPSTSNTLTKIDQWFDKTDSYLSILPIVSLVNGLFRLFIKAAVIPILKERIISNSYYFNRLESRPYQEIRISMIPFYGNYFSIQEVYQKRKLYQSIDTLSKKLSSDLSHFNELTILEKRECELSRRLLRATLRGMKAQETQQQSETFNLFDLSQRLRKKIRELPENKNSHQKIIHKALESGEINGFLDLNEEIQKTSINHSECISQFVILMNQKEPEEFIKVFVALPKEVRESLLKENLLCESIKKCSIDQLTILYPLFSSASEEIKKTLIIQLIFLKVDLINFFSFLAENTQQLIAEHQEMHRILNTYYAMNFAFFPNTILGLPQILRNQFKQPTLRKTIISSFDHAEPQFAKAFTKLDEEEQNGLLESEDFKNKIRRFANFNPEAFEDFPPQLKAVKDDNS